MALLNHIAFSDSAASTTVTATVGGNGVLNGGDNTNTHRTTGPGGSIPYAFTFNGIDDYVSFASGITVGSQLTLSAWVYLNSYATNAGGPDWGARTIVDSRDAGNVNIDDSAFFMSVQGTSNGVLNAGVNWDTTVAVGNRCAVTGSVVPLGAWHYVAFVVNGNNCSVYQNGVQTGTNTFTNVGIYDPAAWNIGKFALPALGGYFDGKIAQVKIFDSDESANMLALYKEGFALLAGESAGRFGFDFGI